jgi:dCTP diphosphatase
LADVAAFLFEMADNLKVDLGQAVLAKLEKNALKYPADKARGISTKYTELK